MFPNPASALAIVMARPELSSINVAPALGRVCCHVYAHVNSCIAWQSQATFRLADADLLTVT